MAGGEQVRAQKSFEADVPWVREQTSSSAKLLRAPKVPPGSECQKKLQESDTVLPPKRKVLVHFILSPHCYVPIRFCSWRPPAQVSVERVDSTAVTESVLAVELWLVTVLPLVLSVKKCLAHSLIEVSKSV